MALNVKYHISTRSTPHEALDGLELQVSAFLTLLGVRIVSADHNIGQFEERIHPTEDVRTSYWASSQIIYEKTA